MFIVILIVSMLNVFLAVSSPSHSNVGTSLFRGSLKRSCWTENDLAKLRARMLFEELAPRHIRPELVNDEYVKNILKYFRRALRDCQSDGDADGVEILKEALSDTFGGHLRSDILPTVRFAYYAGYVPYRAVRRMHNFYEELRLALNTQGVGWQEPDKLPLWSNLTVAKIPVGWDRIIDPCRALITKRDSNTCIHLPPPKLDDDKMPSAIALPFKQGGLLSLHSPSSENILLKYYTTAARCILHSSPEKCRHVDFINFNNEIWHWMKTDVAPHLMDEKPYAAYGGVLRVAAAVQNYGRGLSRRNLFDVPPDASPWHPWAFLTQTKVDFGCWTPRYYIFVVVLAAIGICILQICYNYMFGDAGNCHCKGPPSSYFFDKRVGYAKDESSTPAMLPKLKTEAGEVSISKTLCSNTGSVHTQKVYDMNEQTEKMMDVITSDNDDVPRIERSSMDSDESIVRAKSPSPPKLETPISQLKIKREIKARRRLYHSPGDMTSSEATGREPPDSAWSGSSSSESGSSVSDSASHSRSSRDVAWARRVASRHSRGGKRVTSSHNITSSRKSESSPRR